MQRDEATGDELTATELDQAEALHPDQVGELNPAPEIAAEALDQAEPSTRATRPRHKRRNRGGRPSRPTIETALKLGQALGAGQSVQKAAQSAGVGTSSAYRWIARGRSGDPRFATLAAVSKKKGSDWGWKGWDLGSLRGMF
jgi:hypothetical protein